MCSSKGTTTRSTGPATILVLFIIIIITPIVDSVLIRFTRRSAGPWRDRRDRGPSRWTERGSKRGDLASVHCLSLAPFHDLSTDWRGGLQAHGSTAIASEADTIAAPAAPSTSAEAQRGSVQIQRRDAESPRDQGHLGWPSIRQASPRWAVSALRQVLSK